MVSPVEFERQRILKAETVQKTTGNQVVRRRKLRETVIAYAGSLPPYIVAIETFCGAHSASALGLEPQYSNRDTSGGSCDRLVVACHMIINQAT